MIIYIYRINHVIFTSIICKCTEFFYNVIYFIITVSVKVKKFEIEISFENKVNSKQSLIEC